MGVRHSRESSGGVKGELVGKTSKREVTSSMMCWRGARSPGFFSPYSSSTSERKGAGALQASRLRPVCAHLQRLTYLRWQSKTH